MLVGGESHGFRSYTTRTKGLVNLSTLPNAVSLCALKLRRPHSTTLLGASVMPLCASYGPLQKPSGDCSMEGHCSSPTLSWLIDNGTTGSPYKILGVQNSEFHISFYGLDYGLGT
ncbi:hypothetical protein AGABI2DRAFT_181139, partial [Agaricus bisporus var. bisporus H97]|uniref:hypothetical protein n=1 Tax=Agaricus bisporus var. bisporus (strain H97 / ATCC MYA-4626 / FGSC 10389) TaxID=936046 RepID=UPI00029F5457